MLTELQLARVLWSIARGRIAEQRRGTGKDLGASALEWAIISAIVVGVALLIANAIRGVVSNQKNQLCGQAGGC